LSYLVPFVTIRRTKSVGRCLPFRHGLEIEYVGKKETFRREQTAKKQQGNLGQKDAEQQQRSDSELSHMGELSKSNSADNK